MKNKRRHTKKYKRRMRRIRFSIFLLEVVCIAVLLACCYAEDIMELGVSAFWERVPDSMQLEMEGLSQAEIPTGCESVSTVMILRYWGIAVTPEQFIDDFLPCDVFIRKNGVLYGPNPEEVFAGNPYEKGSLGCYPGVILKALDHMKNSDYPGMGALSYKDASGQKLSKLADKYIAKEIPVLLWGTMGMKAPQDGMQYYLQDGSLYTWRAGEHCLVLCGYDAENYYLLDPLQEGQRVAYPKELVEERYEQMGKRAVVIWR